MGTILLWIGIVLIVIGWIALACQAAKRMSAKNEMNRFTEKRKAMQLRRNYCFLTILAGIVLIVIATAI